MLVSTKKTGVTEQGDADSSSEEVDIDPPDDGHSGQIETECGEVWTVLVEQTDEGVKNDGLLRY